MDENAGTAVPQAAACDVVVVGGGPAGSTIATLLHERGWRVVMLEQDRHPRFHIGESLLPMNLPIFERLGVLDQVRAIGVVKNAAEFSPAGSGDRAQAFYFADALDPQPPYAFQVRRAEFDEVLFRNAAARGVEAHEGERVRGVDFRADGPHLVHSVDATGRPRTWTARLIVDASGRDTLLARKFGLKEKNPRHQSAAIFGHFRKVVRRPGSDAGNISIYWFRHGWFWMIPLRDDVMSVGAVCWPEYLKTRTTSPEEFLWQTIKLCPEVAQRMQNAELCDKARATGNYSYKSRKMYGPGYLMVGDAYAFIDPVFSTGVYLAMNSASLGAAAADAWLRDPNTADAAFRHFERQVERGIRTVSWFIYRFTSPAMQELFMAPRNVLRIQQAVISMLAGDIFGRSPIGLPLVLFKAVFFAKSVARLPQAWRSYRRRRRNVAVAFSGGTLAEDNLPSHA